MPALVALRSVLGWVGELVVQAQALEPMRIVVGLVLVECHRLVSILLLAIPHVVVLFRFRVGNKAGLRGT